MIHLKELQEKKIYLRFNEKFKKEFFEMFENNFDVSILKDLGYKTVNQQWKVYKHNEAFYPLFLIKKLCEMLERINSKFSIDKIEKNIIAIKSGGRGGAIFNPRFSIGFSDHISRLIAHILGDGDIHVSGRIRYTNSDKNLISSFIADLKILGNVEIKEGYDSDAYRIYTPRIVKLVLDEFGLKDRSYSFILNKNVRNQAAFIQALFDDEGSVNLSSPRIAISSSNRVLLDTIKLCLAKSFCIVSRIYFNGYYYDRKGNKKSMWGIDITGFKNFVKFSKSIGSKHSEKIIKLKKLLKLYEGKKIRPLRYETRNKILGLLNKRDMTKHELTKKLGMPLNTVSSQTRKLRKMGNIFRAGRIKISKQNAIIWSLKDRHANFIENYDYDKFSKILLKELDKPKNVFYLSKKFNRCRGSILYFLRKMEVEGLVRRIKINQTSPHIWLRR